MDPYTGLTKDLIDQQAAEAAGQPVKPLFEEVAYDESAKPKRPAGPLHGSRRGRPKGSTVDPLEIESDAATLHNVANAPTLVKQEKIWHRALLYMKMRGMNNKECAAQLGVTAEHVSTVTRQPWFIALATSEMQQEGRAEFQELIKGEAEETLSVLKDLRDQGPAAVRLGAAKEILDRALGKSVARTEKVAGLSDKISEIEGIDKEMAELEKELGLSKN